MSSVRLRFLMVSTVLQATMMAAALETEEAVRAHDIPDEQQSIILLTTLFERGEPSGVDVVRALLPGTELVVVDTQRDLDRLLAGRWLPGASADAHGASVEVWSANPTGYFTRQLLRAFPAAELVLTEDGLATQLLSFNASTRIPNLRGNGLRLVRHRLKKHGSQLLKSIWFGVRRQEARRLAQIYCFLPPPGDIRGVSPKIVRIPPEFVREALERIAGVYSIPVLHELGRHKSVIVVGQVFGGQGRRREPGSVAEPDHPRAYLHLMEKLRAAGYDVWWKPHPRDQNGLRLMGELLGTREAPFRVLDLGMVPMELVIMRNPSVPVVGMGSASLVYGRSLIGAPTFRMSSVRPRGRLGSVVADALSDESSLLAKT